MSTAVFVAGTDTGIGKTHVSCALLHALRMHGQRAVGMKPVASGCLVTPAGLRNDDALALIAASDPRPDYATCNPFAFIEAVSPHLAAAAEGAEVTMPPIKTAFAQLAQNADVVLVEGVGGWLAPLSPTLEANALPQALGLPVILVVGLRLGCLNHAQLTARAILADGCRLLGWVGNAVDPAMDRYDDNLESLRRLLPAPCLGVLPHGLAPAQAAELLDSAVVALE
ncbi:dethiobiotin synthase [Rhodanobacter sp. AS-Z3]|uniref:dethiobiotin synthase n=1 Tax=Rhodanobacter sp. AS-Z3 TaxID=3031330 RepID=UPI0024798E5F|nr:dethiobiotin synthase [Rhodanobacter sp. AS-Z3]WEN15258.1 dethiobiotin synthase [Rhodanobacter sp. AS-Z3]